MGIGENIGERVGENIGSSGINVVGGDVIVSATRVFVDSTLPSDVTDGTYNAGNTAVTGDAYNTLQKALDNHVVGNHIILRGDTYTGCWVLPLNLNGSSWTEGSYNRIESCNITNGGSVNEWAVLDGNYDCGTVGSAQGGQVIGYGVQSTNGSISSYWKFSKIEIKNGNAPISTDGVNTTGYGFHGNGGPFWFEFCYIHDNKGLNNNDNIPSGVYGYNWKNSIVENCWFANNGDGSTSNTNGHNIAWCAQYEVNSQATIAEDGFSTGLVCGYTQNNIVRYNLCDGSVASIGTKHFTMLTGRNPATSDYIDTYKDYGNKIHHNIVKNSTGPAIGAHSDFDQVYNNMIIDCAAGVWSLYDYVAYWNLHKVCVYNNTIVDPTRLEVVMQLGQKWVAAQSSEHWQYVFNNIMDGAGGSNYQWRSDESAITIVDTAFDVSNCIFSNNYAYRPAGNQQYSFESSIYTSVQYESQTVTSTPRVAYANTYDSGNLVYATETGTSAYTIDGTHLIETGVTLADGGYDAAHPYLSGVTIPGYIGAVDPNADEWVTTINEFATLDTGIPVNLRDGIGV